RSRTNILPNSIRFPRPPGWCRSFCCRMARTLRMAFDDWARLLETTLKNSTNAVLNSHTYTLNELNQRTGQTRTYGSSASYGYDYLGQLTSASEEEQLLYGYDLAGNLTNRVRGVLTNAFV